MTNAQREQNFQNICLSSLREKSACFRVELPFHRNGNQTKPNQTKPSLSINHDPDHDPPHTSYVFTLFFVCKVKTT